MLEWAMGRTGRGELDMCIMHRIHISIHVIYYFYVDHYNISRNDAQLIILCKCNVYSFLYT
jgi:hypothetical protein